MSIRADPKDRLYLIHLSLIRGYRVLNAGAFNFCFDRLNLKEQEPFRLLLQLF